MTLGSPAMGLPPTTSRRILGFPMYLNFDNFSFTVFDSGLSNMKVFNSDKFSCINIIVIIDNFLRPF